MDALKNVADEDLVVLYAEGNNEAFDVLLNRYEKRIFSYIYFIVHSQELAEDIFQDTFVKADTAREIYGERAFPSLAHPHRPQLDY